MRPSTYSFDYLLRPIDLTVDDLRQFQTLPLIIEAVIFQTSSYWLKKDLSNKVCILHFDNAEEQCSIVRPIIRDLQRLKMPSNALLDALCNYILVKESDIMKTNPIMEKK